MKGLAHDIPLVKKSKLRAEIEALLEQKGLVLETGITAANIDSGETHRFEDYPEFLAFLKGRKGRWYITTPGLKSRKDSKDK